jgi:hypothetical protein
MPGGPFAVLVKLDVPYSEGTDTHTLRLELLDSDGHPFEVPTGEGETAPLVVEQSFCTEIPPGVVRGTPLDHVYTFTAVGLPFAPGFRYEWRLTVDGKSNDDWYLAFNTAGVYPAAAA